MYILGDIGNTETKLCIVSKNNKISKKITFLSKSINNKQLNILFKKNKIQLNKIDFQKITSFEIFSHTRWASVGDVTNSNCHPLIENKDKNFNLSLMNGDINNYIELKKKLIKNKKYFFSKNFLIFQKKSTVMTVLLRSMLLLCYSVV